jgi:Response regulator containing CheY-like receiver, AAA-type ATPase, and DNA-binding domains
MSPHAAVCIPDTRLRSLFSLLLTDAGAVVASCPDHEEVLRVLGSRFCRLCVLVQGSTPDTGEFLAQARQLSPDTRFLLLANREEVDAVLPLFGQGLSDALLQPINPKRAVVALQRLLGGDRIDAPAPRATGTVEPPIPAETDYRPLHLVTRSGAMRRLVRELWNARNDPVGVILRGEPGVEFELVAREFQAMGGDFHGGLVVLSARDLDVETLATQVSLDRLNEGVPRTYFVPEVEKVPKAQEKPLLDFLRRARRQREREKPLRIVFAAHDQTGMSGASDGEFLEELQFIVPAVVNVPALRERREDIGLVVRRVLTDLTAIFPEYRPRSIHPAAMQWLEARTWRGNHQELVAAVRRAVAECPHRELTATHFGKLTEGGSDPEELAAARVLAAVERATAKPGAA